MPDLSDLIARVEALEGADREVDAALHLLLFPDDFASKIMRGDYVVQSWELGHGGLSYVSLNSGGTSGGTQPIARVTASLDAALALVERCLPGWELEIASEHKAEGPVWRVGLGDRLLGFDGEAPTPALALILALLHALAAKEPS